MTPSLGHPAPPSPPASVPLEAVSVTASPGFPLPLASSWACSVEGTARSESGKRYQPRYFLPVQAVTMLSFCDNSSYKSGASPWLQQSLGAENVISLLTQLPLMLVTSCLRMNSSLFPYSCLYFKRKNFRNVPYSVVCWDPENIQNVSSFHSYYSNSNGSHQNMDIM